jgi:hypothetical protein
VSQKFSTDNLKDDNNCDDHHGNDDVDDNDDGSVTKMAVTKMDMVSSSS